MHNHWQNIYLTKTDGDLSWHQDDPGISLELILQVANRNSRVIEVGGGTSIMAARLHGAGIVHVAVLDISEVALERAKQRYGTVHQEIEWIVGDITKMSDLGEFDVWHDRAVFHFFTSPGDRRKYIALATRTIPIGGHLIIGTFALDGPERCSGLPVEHYDGTKLAVEFGKGFALRKELKDSHLTPWGASQVFNYAVFERVPGFIDEP